MRVRFLLVSTYEEISRSFLKPQGGQISIKKYLETVFGSHIEIEIVDPQIEGLTYTYSQLEKGWHYIGYYSTYPTLLNTIGIMNYGKKCNPDGIHIIGGPGAYYEKIFEISPADICITGEGEKILEQILRTLSDRKLNHETAASMCNVIPNLRVRVTNPYLSTYSSEVGIDKRAYLCSSDELSILSSFRSWERELHIKYMDWTRRMLNHAYGFPVYFVRGCRSIGCKFCSSYHAFSSECGSRVCGVEAAVSFIKEITQAFPMCDQIMVEDDNFLSDRDWVNRFGNGILKSKLEGDISTNLQFIVKTRIDYLDDRLLLWMKRIGVVQINVGVESASGEVLRELNKTSDVSRYLGKVNQIVQWSKRYQMKFHCYLIFFTPESTIDSFISTLRLAAFLMSQGIEISCYSVLLAFPGSSYENDWKADSQLVSCRHSINPMFSSVEHQLDHGRFLHSEYGYLPYKIEMPEHMQIHNDLLRKIHDMCESSFEETWSLIAQNKGWAARTSFRSTYVRVLSYVQTLQALLDEQKMILYRDAIEEIRDHLDLVHLVDSEEMDENMSCEHSCNAV